MIMFFKTEEQAIAMAESMAEAACDARAVISYLVYDVTPPRAPRRYRVTNVKLAHGTKIVAWFHSDGERVVRRLVGR